MAFKKYKIWVDEAGRWPWFWPVVAVAFTFNPYNLPPKEFISELNDSKKLTEKKREKLFKKLIEYSQTSPENMKSLEFPLAKGEKWQSPKVFFWIGEADNHLIDELNIKKATREAMRRALVDIQRKIKKEEIDSVLIDGNDKFSFEELERKPIYIVEWDAKVSEISAASIIAKVFRDKLLETYSLLYPNFQFEAHKWYGTKAHQKALKDSGVTGFHRVSYKPVKAILEQKPKLLLHVCCWPDATIPIVDLKEQYDITCFWYDPNIQPKAEYDKRLEAFKKVCEIEDIAWIEGEYDVKNFFERIKWLEETPEKGEKCTECYDMRLERTSQLARELGITYWTTTLNISPHKDLEKMFRLGDKWSAPSVLTDISLKEGDKKKLEFLKIAFRKNWGFQRSVEYTKKYDIYRQNYCGCVYSDTFPWSEKAKGKKKSFSG